MRFAQSPIMRARHSARCRVVTAPPRARVAPWPLLLAALLATLSACGGSEGGNATGTGSGPSRTGSLAVAIAGLPAGATAAVTVAGPGGYSKSVGASETLSGLQPGTYDVTAAEATTGADRYAPLAASLSATVVAGQSASIAVSYAIQTGAIALTTSGLPGSAQPDIAIAGPNGFTRTAKGGTTVAGLAPGTYVLTPASLVVDAHTYAPAAPSVTVSVLASVTPLAAPLPYGIASGALVVTIAGLPEGTSAQAQVSGPNGFKRQAASGETLTNLVPGSYTITGEAVEVGADAYRVTTPQTVQVIASTTPLAASLPYTLASGRLAVSVSGLPAGSDASITVTGPENYAHMVTANETMRGLVPGSYTLTASPVGVGPLMYSPSPETQTIVVAASTTPVTTSVTYAVSTGSLTVTVVGLPQAVSAAISVAGPASYAATVTTATTLNNLRPGTYTLTAANAVAGPHSYAPTPASRTVTVVAGGNASASFTYALATGGLALNVSGLPSNVAADITVSGPGGYTRAVNSTSLLLGLATGSYTITSRVVQSGGAAWAPHPATQTLTLPASTSATAAAVNYVTAVGTLVVTVNGLPGGIAAAVTVTGPNAYSRTLTATTTITGLIQGTYTVAAAAVTNGGTSYAGSPATQNISVGGGVTSSLTVTYTVSAGPPPPPPPPAGLNLVIDGMHVQQVVQSYGGTVPLVAGRDGLLRVFVKASATNTSAPTVRVRFYTGATLASTVTINAPSASVPQTITEGTLTSSWNTTVPASLMQPGLRILADVDPTNTVVESAESDNAFPTSGTPANIDVRSVPTLSMRFVPVLQSANALQGNVTSGNASAFLADMRSLFPLATVDVDVRSAFTTAAPALNANDTNGAWGQILSEVNALRAADGSTRYYYGVVRVGYSSGIAGLGYVPGRSAIGWDALPSASDVMAHEVGHNFGRLHAPACGAGGPDPAFPHADGKIGVYGYDLGANTLKSPATFYDLMGYCSTNWISDYTYSAILNYRQSNPFITPTRVAGGTSARRGLLVWGRLERGQVLLEPAFEVTASPVMPTGRGRHRLQAFGDLGEPLLDIAFEGEQVADHADPTAQHFAFVIPLEAMRGRVPARLRATALGRQAELRSVAPAGAAGADDPVVERLDSRRVRVRWDANAALGVLVRDARSGEILSFARGGDAVVHTSASTVDLTTSDGVRSSTRRVAVAGGGGGPRR